MESATSQRLRNIIAIVTLISSAIFATLNYLNSRATNEQINWVTEQMKVMSKEKEMTRTMLDSRAKIQMMMWSSLDRNNFLTSQERIEGYKLWAPAEYNLEQRPK